MKKTVLNIILVTSLLTLPSCGVTDEKTGTSGTPATQPVTTETTIVTDTSATETSAIETESTTVTAITQEKTEEQPKEMNGAPNSDFVTISGDWYIDGDPSLASMHIEPDGTFKTYYATGNLENEGTIRYENEEIEGTVINWYMLYDKNGEFVMGFIDDGSSPKTDLYIGNGGFPHYQKFGQGGLADDGRGEGDEFIGTWGCERATLKIDQIYGTEFHAVISWSSSAYAHVEWDYPLTYQNGRLVCSGNATKTYVEYSAPDIEPDKTVEYTNGSAEFTMQGAGIVWNDITEHSGDGMVFGNTLPE